MCNSHPSKGSYDRTHLSQQKNIIVSLMIMVLVFPVLITCIDDIARDKVKQGIRSEQAAKKLLHVLIQEAEKEIGKTVDLEREKLGKIKRWIAEWKCTWQGRKTAAQQAAVLFINKEIKDKRLSIQIKTYPQWGLGWSINRYEFKLIWMKDIVGTFRLDTDFKLISNQLNKDSKFIKTVHNKVSEAAIKPDRQFCKETSSQFHQWREKYETALRTIKDARVVPISDRFQRGDEESTKTRADDNAQKIFAEEYFGLD